MEEVYAFVGAILGGARASSMGRGASEEANPSGEEKGVWFMLGESLEGNRLDMSRRQKNKGKNQ